MLLFGNSKLGHKNVELFGQIDVHSGFCRYFVPVGESRSGANRLVVLLFCRKEKNVVTLKGRAHGFEQFGILLSVFATGDAERFGTGSGDFLREL